MVSFVPMRTCRRHQNPIQQVYILSYIKRIEKNKKEREKKKRRKKEEKSLM